jgi:phosphoribosylaminoimidazole-succinocarboxamide synthase
MSRFDSIVFTPTDKSETDDPVRAVDILSRDQEESELARAAYGLVETFLAGKGITLIDSKLEIGNRAVADEVVTPDSSRFAWTREINEGQVPPWLDKQSVRDYAEGIWGEGRKVPLELSVDIVDKTSNTYTKLLSDITSLTIEKWRDKLDQKV